MKRHAAATAALVLPGRGELVDWRIERLSLLMNEDRLAGEWDPERQLILPSPGGRLTRVLRCVVADCPSDGHGSSLLCHLHGRQFEASDLSDVQAWVDSGRPGIVQRRWCSEQRCAVGGVDGTGCPRPAQGPWRVCDAHANAWARRQERGVAFEVFLAQARPLPDLGPCAAACCYLGAAHSHSGLCQIHYPAWRRAGRPTGRAFTVWAARVRQPTNSRPTRAAARRAALCDRLPRRRPGQCRDRRDAAVD